MSPNAATQRSNPQTVQSEAPRAENDIYSDETVEYTQASDALREVLSNIHEPISLLALVDLAHEKAPTVPLDTLGASAFDLAGSGYISIDLASRVTLTEQAPPS